MIDGQEFVGHSTLPNASCLFWADLPEYPRGLEVCLGDGEIKPETVEDLGGFDPHVAAKVGVGLFEDRF